MGLCDFGQTIILTTHYIEEARNANTVAFMRSGKILAEDEPILLLNRYEANNLEDVFLKLCNSQTESTEDLRTEDMKTKDISKENQRNTQIDEKLVIYAQRIAGGKIFSNVQVQNFKEENMKQNYYNSVQTLKVKAKNDCKDVRVVMTPNESNEDLISVRNSSFNERLSALLHKNYIRITRNWRVLLFELILPSILLMVVIYSIGERPTGINLAVFDEESKYNRTDNWGKIFIDHMDKGRF